MNLLLISDDSEADMCGNEHYCLINNMSRLLKSQVTKKKCKTCFCHYCLQHFNSQKSLENHLGYCSNYDCVKTEFPQKKVRTIY